MVIDRLLNWLVPDWLLIEDWTQGKYPDHMGGTRVFAVFWTQQGAERGARRMNRMFMRAIPDRRPNVFYRVERDEETNGR